MGFVRSPRSSPSSTASSAHPAATDREIIDRSYSYALVVSFADEAGHEAYQVHPVHDRFREQCGGSWKKIVIYDAVSA
jgi:hypothetical protein